MNMPVFPPLRPLHGIDELRLLGWPPCGIKNISIRCLLFEQRSNVTVVDWGGLENIAKGRPLRKSSARTVMFRPGAGEDRGDKRGPRAAEFELASPFEPTGDQPQAITELVGGLEEGRRFQVRFDSFVLPKKSRHSAALSAVPTRRMCETSRTMTVIFAPRS